MRVKPKTQPVVVLGVTGSIAAYKAADICSQLVKAGCAVRVVLTADAQKFITPLPFKTLFHELAHQMLYVRGDAQFNESFAVALEQVLDAAHVQARAGADGAALVPHRLVAVGTEERHVLGHRAGDGRHAALCRGLAGY